MHWVDMQWLWGYHVLPGSVRDMIKFCRETGAKGCVNFDGIGYEKLAAENPVALAELRTAVQEAWIEPVGCSYGQPYGQFHGGESNVRQRVYGVRAVQRLLGVRPRTFWEEEFDFFPQLPQILTGVGFTGSSLFFQWTWHTPEVPFEPDSVVWWEGLDGSRLLAATRNRLNLHQWPEDFQLLLDDLANQPAAVQDGSSVPLIQQWLELMPSPDWMCRAELMIPKLLELKEDERFDVSFSTLGGYLDSVRSEQHPVRQYRQDDVWHGLTLGKNGDLLRQESAKVERTILEAEALHAVLGVFGRPYANWDVYPVWELEEAWRELLSAQHHDNDECEGLCGHVGKDSYNRAHRLARTQWFRARHSFASRIGDSTRLNLFGWAAEEIGAFGFSQAEREGQVEPDWRVEWTGESWKTTQGSLSIGLKLPTFSEWKPSSSEPSFESPSHRGVFRADKDRLGLHLTQMERSPGYKGAARVTFDLEAPAQIWSDHPYGVSQVHEGQKGRRKYPEGDWMTSPQWFEEVSGGFTSLSFVRIKTEREDWLVCHEGTRQWFRTETGIECIAHAYDPWDGDESIDESARGWTIVDSTGFSHSDCVKAALQRLNLSPSASSSRPAAGEPDIWLRDFSFLHIDQSNVIPTALYREAEDFAGMHLENFAGTGMGYPYVLRLVEYDGLETPVRLTIAGPVARAFKTNLLGEIEAELSAARGEDNLLSSTPELLAPFGIVAAVLEFKVRPYEIATLYLDIVPGRKQTRDLDAKRKIWATVHRSDAS